MSQRFVNKIAERLAMNAYANVISGRESRWYANPLALLVKPFLFGMWAFAMLWTLFTHIVMPVLVLVIFIMACRMNTTLNRIEAGHKTTIVMDQLGPGPPTHGVIE